MLSQRFPVSPASGFQGHPSLTAKFLIPFYLKTPYSVVSDELAGTYLCGHIGLSLSLSLSCFTFSLVIIPLIVTAYFCEIEEDNDAEGTG